MARIWLGGGAIVAVIIAVVALVFADRLMLDSGYWLRCTDMPAPPSRSVLIIGDSWVSASKLDAGIAANIGEPAAVCSLGFPGATTKTIATYLQADPWVLTNIANRFGGEISDVVILAGLNDAARGHSQDFYARHVGLVASLASPVARRTWVLETPPFDYDRKDATIAHTARRWLYEILSGVPKPDVVESYRRSLRSTLGGDVRVIPIEPFLPSYAPARYVDGVHLTADEYTHLGQYIATALQSTSNELAAP